MQDKNLVYDAVDLMDFLESEDPHAFLTKMNKFLYDKESKKIIEANMKELKPPVDLELIISDIKVVGRREFQLLLRLRHKYQIMTTR